MNGIEGRAGLLPPRREAGRRVAPVPSSAPNNSFLPPTLPAAPDNLFMWPLLQQNAHMLPAKIPIARPLISAAPHCLPFDHQPLMAAPVFNHVNPDPAPAMPIHINTTQPQNKYQIPNRGHVSECNITQPQMIDSKVLNLGLNPDSSMLTGHTFNNSIVPKPAIFPAKRKRPSSTHLPYRATQAELWNSQQNAIKRRNTAMLDNSLKTTINDAVHTIPERLLSQHTQRIPATSRRPIIKSTAVPAVCSGGMLGPSTCTPPNKEPGEDDLSDFIMLPGDVLLV